MDLEYTENEVVKHQHYVHSRKNKQDGGMYSILNNYLIIIKLCSGKVTEDFHVCQDFIIWITKVLVFQEFYLEIYVQEVWDFTDTFRRTFIQTI